MATLLKQVPGQQRYSLAARTPALETAAKVNVDPGVRVHRVSLLVILDAPGNVPADLHHQQHR